MQRKEFLWSIVNGIILGLVTYFFVRIFPTFFSNVGVEDYRLLFVLPILLLFSEFLVLKFAVKKNLSLAFYVTSYVIAVMLVIVRFIY